MADRRHGHPAPPTDTEIFHEDWDGHDLTGQRHSRVAFLDVDMTEVTNTGSVFDECTFRHVAFNASTHTDAAFTNCTFTSCSFFDATFHRCKMLGSMFSRCTYGVLKVDGGDWSFVGLPGAKLSSASFQDVRMREADLTGAAFEGARLLRVDLSGSWLHGAKMSGCDLRGSDLSTLDPVSTEIHRAVIDVDQAVVVAGAVGFDVRPL
ncbi:MAG TPA: pentapeptide repeat-containing protein [Nocardioidaceae bacterium]|nr:pentapeptide repeat-containing protein [Nocardioidaceae bacterium]